MTFAVDASAYDRFMGLFSIQLSWQLADLAEVEAGQRVLDVGCGPGALVTELVTRLGARNVAAVDPSESFVEAARTRHPKVDVRVATAEELPFEDNEFDAALAQLVVHVMTDPVAGLREMARVTKAGGVVAASVWDMAGERAPISPFWKAARALRSDVEGEWRRAGGRAGHLTELFGAAGLRDVAETELHSAIKYESFDEWWEPFTLGVGPAGAYAKSLDAQELEAVREEARGILPEAPFTLETVAWAARGTV